MRNESETCEDTIDFATLDKVVRITYRADRMETVNKAGYDYFSEFIFDKYYVEGQSLVEVGRQLGYHSKGLAKIMQAYGFKRRGRGGNTRNPRLTDSVKDQIHEFKGQGTINHAAKKFGCSPSTVEKMWANAA